LYVIFRESSITGVIELLTNEARQTSPEQSAHRSKGAGLLEDHQRDLARELSLQFFQLRQDLSKATDPE
jgi:hypothetical protein